MSYPVISESSCRHLEVIYLIILGNDFICTKEYLLCEYVFTLTVGSLAISASKSPFTMALSLWVFLPSFLKMFLLFVSSTSITNLNSEICSEMFCKLLSVFSVFAIIAVISTILLLQADPSVDDSLPDETYVTETTVTSEAPTTTMSTSTITFPLKGDKTRHISCHKTKRESLICKLSESRKVLVLPNKSRKRRTPAYIEPERNFSIKIDKHITVENLYVVYDFIASLPRVNTN